MCASARRISYAHNARTRRESRVILQREIYNPINTFDHGRGDAIDKSNRARTESIIVGKNACCTKEEEEKKREKKKRLNVRGEQM